MYFDKFFQERACPCVDKEVTYTGRLKVALGMSFSAGLQLTGLDDFIAPSQACIKPVENPAGAPLFPLVCVRAANTMAVHAAYDA